MQPVCLYVHDCGVTTGAWVTSQRPHPLRKWLFLPKQPLVINNSPKLGMGRLDFLSHPCLDFVWLDLVEMHVVKLPCAHVCNSPLVSIHTAAVQLSTVSDILSNPSSTIIPEPCVYTCVCGGCVFVYVFVHVCACGGVVCACVFMYVIYIEARGHSQVPSSAAHPLWDCSLLAWNLFRCWLTSKPRASSVSAFTALEIHLCQHIWYFYVGSQAFLLE